MECTAFPDSLPVVRLQMVREAGLSYNGESVQCSGDAAALFREHLGDPPHEILAALYLDTKNKPLCLCIVASGGMNAASAAPAEVFKPALLANAAAVILCHNHPSGDPQPSPNDREFTKRMAEAAKLLGVRLLDHVVLGAARYESFADRGWL